MQQGYYHLCMGFGETMLERNHVGIVELEYSVDFLRKISGGITPEKEIRLGKTLRLSGLERQLNILREINMDRTTAWEEDRKK